MRVMAKPKNSISATLMITAAIGCAEAIMADIAVMGRLLSLRVLLRLI